MRIIGVVDLLRNQAVRAEAGDRSRYRPVEAVAGSSIASGNAPALARAYIDRFGLDELYVADLDAILGRPPQSALVRRLGSFGVPLWLDAGTSSIEQARRVVQPGVAHLIVGLETLSSFEALDDICGAIIDPPVAFSLDLRHGEPIASPGGEQRPEAIAARAAAAGATAVIVLELSRVGTGSGPDLATIARIRRAVPGTTLLAGGGVRGFDDLARLAESGCDGALVATALHDGRLTAADVKQGPTLNILNLETRAVNQSGSR
jgi:phosphoribosylformimino-5-aminoimidazole carboxamide ribotide isomerase